MNDPIGLFSILHIGSTGGGGGGTTSTRLIFTETTFVDVASGDVVTVVLESDSAGNGGKITKANASVSGRSSVIGIAISSAAAGTNVDICLGGKIPVLFQTAPATADRGKKVYLSPTNDGKAVLGFTPSSGQTLYEIGTVLDSNGITTTPNVVLNMAFVVSA